MISIFHYKTIKFLNYLSIILYWGKEGYSMWGKNHMYSKWNNNKIIHKKSVCRVASANKNTSNWDKFKVQFALNNRLTNWPVIYMQRLLNPYEREHNNIDWSNVWWII